MKYDFFQAFDYPKGKCPTTTASRLLVITSFLSGSIKRGIKNAFDIIKEQNLMSSGKIKKLVSKKGGNIINGGKENIDTAFFIGLFKLETSNVIKDEILKTVYKDLKFTDEDIDLYESEEEDKSGLLNLSEDQKNLTAKRRAFYYVCDYFGEIGETTNKNFNIESFIKNTLVLPNDQETNLEKNDKKESVESKTSDDNLSKLKKDFKKIEKELAKALEENQKLKDQNDLSAKEYKKNEDKLNSQIITLKEKIEQYENNKTEVSKENKVKGIIHSSKVSKPSLEEEKEETIDSSFNRISTNEIYDTVTEFPVFGTVEPYNIIPEKKEGTFTIFIKPVNPLVPNLPYIERDEFYKELGITDSSIEFKLLVNNRIVKKYCTFTIDAEQFDYMSTDEQMDVIIDTFCKKSILFIPDITYQENEKGYSFNAKVLDVCDIKFCQSSPIPIIKDFGSKKIKEFISEGKNISFKNLPITLFNSVPYVIIDEVLYLTDLIPQTKSSDTSMWKPKEKTFQRIGDLNLKDKEKFIVSEKHEVVFANLSSIGRTSKVETKNEDVIETKFIDDFINLAKNNNLCYTDEDLKNFHISLKSSQLVILAGPSGIGKTRLPLLYSKMLNIDEDKGNLLFVNINPSLNEPSDLLGYVKPVLNNGCNEENKIDGTYMESSSGLVSFLKAANDKKDRLHIVIFDEMNLAQIEYWFAPFISILERDAGERKLNLYAQNLKLSNSDKYPSSISIGDNVIFIGTINIDETTKEISDRVFDRAVVLKLHKKSFSSFLTYKDKNFESTKDYKIPYSVFNSFRKNSPKYINVFNEKEIEFLDKVHDTISSIGGDKGVSFRNLKTISNYLANSEDIFPRKDAFDYAINQTIIQKIRGADFEVKELFEEEGKKSLISIMDEFKDVSDFKETRQSITKKRQELSIYGFTK